MLEKSDLPLNIQSSHCNGSPRATPLLPLHSPSIKSRSGPKKQEFELTRSCDGTGEVWLVPTVETSLRLRPVVPLQVHEGGSCIVFASGGRLTDISNEGSILGSSRIRAMVDVETLHGAFSFRYIPKSDIRDRLGMLENTAWARLIHCFTDSSWLFLVRSFFVIYKQNQRPGR